MIYICTCTEIDHELTGEPAMSRVKRRLNLQCRKQRWDLKWLAEQINTDPHELEYLLAEDTLIDLDILADLCGAKRISMPKLLSSETYSFEYREEA